MKYETIHNLILPKIGFGTWKIGGESFPNPKMDSVSLSALRSALEFGYTHIDAAEIESKKQKIVNKVVYSLLVA